MAQKNSTPARSSKHTQSAGIVTANTARNISDEYQTVSAASKFTGYAAENAMHTAHAAA